MLGEDVLLECYCQQRSSGYVQLCRKSHDTHRTKKQVDDLNNNDRAMIFSY